MNNIRTLEEYKEDVFDKLDEQQKLEWLYEMSTQINRAVEYIKQYGNLYCLKHKQFKDYHQYKVLLDILQEGDKE